MCRKIVGYQRRATVGEMLAGRMKSIAWLSSTGNCGQRRLIAGKSHDILRWEIKGDKQLASVGRSFGNQWLFSAVESKAANAGSTSADRWGIA